MATSSSVLQRYRFIRGNQLLDLESFVRLQDSPIRYPELPQEGNNGLILFVSHRWETPQHPDPHQHQPRALQSLLHSICDILITFHPDTTGVHDRIPSLRIHGIPQAAHLALDLMNKLDWNVVESRCKTPHEMRALILDHVHIWYDFAVLPQRPRTKEQNEEFRDAMLHLDEFLLFPRTKFLALRAHKDDYEERGWCLAEALLSSRDSQMGDRMILRVDRMGMELPALVNKNLDVVFDEWCSVTSARQAIRVLIKLDGIVWICPIRNAFEGNDPLCCMMPGIIEKSVLLETMIWSLLAFKTVVDLEELLIERMEAGKVNCTNGSDLAFCALIILGCKSRANLDWKEALRRKVDKESLKCRVSIRPLQPGEKLTLPNDLSVEFLD